MAAVCVQSLTDPMNHCIYVQNVVSMCLIGLLTVNTPQTIAWYYFTVIATVNWTV